MYFMCTFIDDSGAFYGFTMVAGETVKCTKNAEWGL